MRHTIVKSGMAFAAALLIASCSSNSPTAPPTPTPASYNIALTTSGGSAEVGTAILFSARVTSGSANVADGTSVTFKLTGCVAGGATDPSFENGLCEMTRTTSSGVATASVISRSTAGYFEVVARVAGSSAAATVRFVQPTNPRTLAIYSVVPNVGSYAGGETVTVHGRGFATPLAVDFIVGGIARHALVSNVTADGATATVITPNTQFIDVATQPADIMVTSAAGSQNPVTDTLIRGFSYTFAGAGDPQIYAIVPSQGLVTGGETVTIYGSNFSANATVMFGVENVRVMSISADGFTIVLQTPRHSGPPDAQNPVPLSVNVIVTNPGGKSVTRANGFTWLAVVQNPGSPVIYQVVPNTGSPRGGETIKILGANLCGTVSPTGQCASNPTVVFGLATGDQRTAQVVSVTPDGTQLTVITPQVSPNPVLTDILADITVTNGVQPPASFTLTKSFTFKGESGPPIAYYLTPDRGSVLGHDLVTIYGRYFLRPVRVTFVGVGDAVVQDVAADGTTVTVLTPPVTGAAPVNPVDVTITSQAGTGREQSATLIGAFQYLEGQTPEIYSLSPNSGPTTGGTRVTITGKGFQYPVQVFFEDGTIGQKQAQVISQNYNTVICLSPSITPSAPGTPETVSVSVVNATTGKKSNTLPFRYGEAMFISAVTPNVAPADAETTITIFGQGFVAPVRVVFVSGTETALQVISVSGTEIIAKLPPLASAARTCSDVVGAIKVTNIDSNISATGPMFTYQALRPLISSVTVDGVGNSVLQYAPPTCATPWTTHTVTVNGANFQVSGGVSAMLVGIPGVTPSCSGGNPGGCIPTTFVSSSQITFQLPDLTGIALNEVSCTTGGGCGMQWVPTPISLMVVNGRNSCSDTLANAIVINPCDTTCRPVAVTSITPTAGTPQTVGIPFTLSIAFAPSPLTLPAPVTLTYVGFAANPAATTIPVSFASPWLVTVTPTSAGIGNIIATVGAGVCQRTGATAPITVNPAAPTVVSVAPVSGPIAGGTAVVISGTNFFGVPTVTFGGVAATGITVINATTINCTTPAHAAGAVAVSVTTVSGTGTLAAGFTYI